MRKNFPVSGKEHHLCPNQSLISRTDLRGVITYANRAFIEACGFSAQELLGSSHNIVRHPDMPEEAFADMWRTLKAGRAWTGMVKNRRKDGDHYWVQADATPIREDGRVTGYTSVRTVPSRAQIEAAESAYARLRHDGAGGLTIRNGEVVRTGLRGRLAGWRRLGIGRRIGLTLGMLCAAMAALAVLCLAGLAAANASVDALYRRRIVTIGELDTIVRQLNRNEIALLETIQGKQAGSAEALARQLRESLAAIERTWLAYRSTASAPGEQGLNQAFDQAYRRYLAAGLEPVLGALGAGDFARANQLHATAMAPSFLPVRKAIDALIGMQLSLAKQEAQAENAHYERIRNGVLAALAFVTVLAVLVGHYLSRSIVRPMRQAVEVAKQIAACNLTAEIRPGSKDETGEMLHALSVMKLSLVNIVGGVRATAENVAANSAEIASGNLDLSARTEQQAANLEETAASMEELTATVNNNAERSVAGVQLVQDANRMARAGGAAMDQVVGSMGTITAGAKRITDIIGVVDSIAFQTNLLALNAAVEAARAGEQGRGFAVVASEVRGLAQRSAAAAREIKQLITDSVVQIDAGSTEVGRARANMDEIVSAVDGLARLMQDISLASREQRIGIGQVGEAVMQMDEATQQNAALVEEAAAASAKLRWLAQDLLQEVGVFKVAGQAPADVAAPERNRQGHAQSAAQAQLALEA